jgi:hypothetical protein
MGEAATGVCLDAGGHLQSDDGGYALRSFQKNRKRNPEKELASFLAICFKGSMRVGRLWQRDLEREVAIDL